MTWLKVVRNGADVLLSEFIINTLRISTTKQTIKLYFKWDNSQIVKTVSSEQTPEGHFMLHLRDLPPHILNIVLHYAYLLVNIPL